MCEIEQTTEEQALLPPRRMHPAGMIFSFIKTIKETILGIGFGALAFFKQSPKYAIIFIALFLLFLIVMSILSWFRHTYRVEEGELRVEQGVLIRKKRYISINRIHKIDLTANVIHRIFKLVGVKVDTASSGGGAEVSLSAIKTSDANELRQALKRKQHDGAELSEDTTETENPVKKISWKHLFIAGTTSGSAGFVILAVFIAFSQVQQYIPDNIYKQTYEWIIQLSIIVIVVLGILALLMLWVFGIAGTMIKFGNFTIEKRPKELFIKRGLLETKELTIPYDRIQAIEIEQSILRQPLKFARITAVIAGGAVEKGEPYPVIFPLLPKRDVEKFLNDYLPDFTNMTQELIPLHKKGRKYFWFKHMIIFILALIPVIYFFPGYSWIPILFIVVSFLYSQLSFRESGYKIDGHRIIFRGRHMLTKSTLMAYKRRIQAYEKSRHKLQRIDGLATAEISLISLGVSGRLRHLSDTDANEIAAWYSLRNNHLNTTETDNHNFPGSGQD